MNQSLLHIFRQHDGGIFLGNYMAVLNSEQRMCQMYEMMISWLWKCYVATCSGRVLSEDVQVVHNAERRGVRHTGLLPNGVPVPPGGRW